MTWTSASVRWWTPARCCKSVTPVSSASWRDWPTFGSSPSTSSTPSCTLIVCSPPPMWCLTNSSPSTKSPSVPSLLGESHYIWTDLNVVELLTAFRKDKYICLASFYTLSCCIKMQLIYNVMYCKAFTSSNQCKACAIAKGLAEWTFTVDFFIHLGSYVETVWTFSIHYTCNCHNCFMRHQNFDALKRVAT